MEMKSVLLLENELNRNKIMFALEAKFGGSESVSTADLNFAKETLSSGGIDLILFDESFTSQAEFPAFTTAIAETPTAFLELEGKAKPEVKNLIATLSRDNPLEELLKVCEEKLKGSETQTYTRIDTELLTGLSPLQFDVFVRLTNEKFIRILKERDPFTSADIQKYKDKKGLDYLYIETKNAAAIIEKFIEEVKSKKAGVSIQAPSNEGAIDIVKTVDGLADNLGFSRIAVDQNKSEVDNVMQSLRQDWSLQGIFTELDKKGGYIASHSEALAYLSCLVTQGTEWSSDYTTKKLCIAALLHDITLNNQAVARCDSVKEVTELGEGKFTVQDLQDFKLHPIRASDYSKKFKNLPHDVELIILQHHEKPDGSGFPRGIKHNHINPLSGIFIVAHELVGDFLKKGADFTIELFLQKIDAFNMGNFEKLIAALRARHQRKS